MLKTTRKPGATHKSVAISRQLPEKSPQESSTKDAHRRMSFTGAYLKEIADSIELRSNMKVIVEIDDQEVDVTPKIMRLRNAGVMFRELLEELTTKQHSFQMMHPSMSSEIEASSVRMGGIKVSMEDLLKGVGSNKIDLERIHWSFDRSISYFKATEEIEEITQHTQPYVKITLKLTDEILLFELTSSTVMRETPEGNEVEQDNKNYDFLTIGRGKVRRRSEAEAQTKAILLKSREINTDAIKVSESGAYVSNFEMFDTYEHLRTGHANLSGMPDLDIFEKTFLQQAHGILQLPSFRLKSMITQRVLSGNEFCEGMQRFRSMKLPDRLAPEINYDNKINVLFRFIPRIDDLLSRVAVADISFCYHNGDIMAVAYGIFSFTTAAPKDGRACIWSIKNPIDPERTYLYSMPVVSVAFSPFEPTLLAIGLYDGYVEVRDISKSDIPPIAISHRSSSPSVDPVVAIRWLKQTESEDLNEIDPFLALGQDGTVTKYRIINSPYLMGFRQMVLERVEGAPEGLPVKPVFLVKQANRKPQCLALNLHPTMHDVYYCLTDEGILHKCSTNYQHQYLEVWKCHDGSVNCMDFSPWSPKLFVTCGNDWTMRIWVDGIFKPLITMGRTMSPIHCVFWSRTISTVLVSLNRKTVDVWDLRRSILDPVSSYEVDTSNNTMCVWSRCGRCLVVGNERGTINVCALDNMPFPPYFQYDELEKALYNALSTNPELTIELKSLGFFGYPNKGYFVPP